MDNHEDLMEKGEILTSAEEDTTSQGNSLDPISSQDSAPTTEATETSEKIPRTKVLRFLSAIRKTRDARPESALNHENHS
jgi:hypothetical protein